MMTSYKPLALALCIATSSSVIAAEFELVLGGGTKGEAALGMNDQNLLALSKSGDFSQLTVKKSLAEILAERNIEQLYPKQ
ncbi:hypothetical protein [Agarivorans aestuarii]|uniref:hypothetical protein n=1 Tax=Agarivorans aestuarii TaxID=1563703 RepID=UPI001C814387|nr:hypothetical protein [Agarivorans aestuarii]